MFRQRRQSLGNIARGREQLETVVLNDELRQALTHVGIIFNEDQGVGLHVLPSMASVFQTSVLQTSGAHIPRTWYVPLRGVR